MAPTPRNRSNNRREPYIHGLYNFKFIWKSPWSWVFYHLFGYKGFMKYIHIPTQQYVEMLSWLNDNVSKRKYRNDVLIVGNTGMGGIVHFKNKDEALLFKLTWS